MNILIIDCTTKNLTICLRHDNTWYSEFDDSKDVSHSVKLNNVILKLAKSANITISDIDVFSCNIGPGSFTGIRVAVATVIGLGFNRKNKLIAINNFEVMSYKEGKSGSNVFIEDNKGFFFSVVNDGRTITEPCHIEKSQRSIIARKELQSVDFQEFDNREILQRITEEKIAHSEFVSELVPMYIRKSQAEDNQNGN